MGCRKKQRQVEFKYEFDRLGRQKMEEVYDILLWKVLREHEKVEKELVQGEKKQ